MRSKNEFLLDIYRQYQKAGHEPPFNLNDVARWAITNGLWAQRPEAVVKQCAQQLAGAMSIEYFEDAHGNRIRAKHAVVRSEGPLQYAIWDDIRTADHKFVTMALQQRRKHILGECKQLKNDADYYNAHRDPPKQIEIVFNFEVDLEEIELLRAAKRDGRRAA